MKVTLHLSSEEAETILFALALRTKQSRLSPLQASNAHALGQYLDDQFTKAFRWDSSIDRMAHWRHPIKSVSIKTYQMPPGQRIEYPQGKEPRKERNQ